MDKVTKDKKDLKKANIFLVVGSRLLFFAIFAMGLIAVLHPDLRQFIRAKFHKQYRVVLSTASGQLLEGSGIMKVIKIRTHEGLFLEVYGRSQLESTTRYLIDRIQLPDNRDGFFNFQGAATNLFLHDVDGDSQLEIVAPSFDEDLVAHLNVYRLNPETRKIEVEDPRD